MKGKMRKETKIGLLILAIFYVLNLITKEIGEEIFVLHFLLGGLVGLAFAEMVIGLLPESIYLKIKNFKKKCNPFIK
jgi:hypothetical protein